jgi:hypothetical protein
MMASMMKTIKAKDIIPEEALEDLMNNWDCYAFEEEPIMQLSDAASTIHDQIDNNWDFLQDHQDTYDFVVRDCLEAAIVKYGDILIEFPELDCEN